MADGKDDRNDLDTNGGVSRRGFLGSVIPAAVGAAVAKEALATGRTLREVVLAQSLMDAAMLDRALDPLRMTRP